MHAAAGTHPIAQCNHRLLRQQRGQLFWVRQVVGNPDARGQSSGPDNQVEMFWTFPTQPGDIEPFEDAEGQQHLEPLTWGRREVDLQAAI